MKKFFIVLSVFTYLVSADGLKDSLSSMLNKKDTSSMVDLNNMSLNAKPRQVKQVVRKTRSSKAVVATVNNHKILKKEADAYLKKRTNGSVSNFDFLSKKQRLRLIKEMSRPMLISDSAKKELSEEEKDAVCTRMWMQKQALKIKISDEEVRETYNQMKQQFEDSNSTGDVPEFESIKNSMKSKMLEKKIINKLMKNVDIKIETISN